MPRIATLVALATLIRAALPVAPAAAQAADAGRTIDAYLSALARDTQFSGTVLVARGATVVLERSYGKARFTAAAANTPATLFAVASITKPMTGIAARLLAERGVLSLDDPIAKWLPDFPNGATITVTHLLSHRSGIPHRVTDLRDEQESQTAESMTRLVRRRSLAFDPGARRLYSSAGYSVLARVLELATGKPYSQLLRELVLEPAGASTAVDATEQPKATAQRATGHFWTHEGPIAAPSKQLSFLVGAGSLWATPRDLFRVVRRVVDGGYGAATAGARDANGMIQWTGFSNGFFTSVDYTPATDLTVVFTSNLLTGAADWIRRDVPRLAGGDTVTAPRAPRPAVVALSQARRQHIEGVYDYFGNQQQLAFLSPTTALLGGEYLLLATGDTSFFAPQNYAEFRVVSDSAGAVTALRLNDTNGFSITRVR